MKKLALVFVLAVLVPSLVLAWLAVRSLRDQQFLLERQQSLLYQRVTDSLANDIAARLAQLQQEFSAQVESLAADRKTQIVAAQFDEQIRRRWLLAEVGFCVTLSGKILSPSANAQNEAKVFVTENSAFLGNLAPAEIYNNANLQQQMLANSETTTFSKKQKLEAPSPQRSQNYSSLDSRSSIAKEQDAGFPSRADYNSRVQSRKVSPQNSTLNSVKDTPVRDEGNLSKVVPAEAEFAQIVGENPDGMLARFLQNKLRLMFWHRLEREPNFIFGAQLDLNRVMETLRPLVKPDESLRDQICLALLDDNAKPAITSRSGFQANWKRPFAATEIGDALPHWEIAAYLINPAQFTAAAHTARLTLGLIIALLVTTIGIGGWLIVRSLNAELKLARQKTDFVSNVSHELKTPLTSIRMFSELLSEGRITEPAKQKSYLNIISAEAGRLTRLINNVLDFSQMERGEKKYHLRPCDLREVLRETCETFQPHFEENGFQFACEIFDTPLFVNGDRDALAQIVVNLLSNAEKYSGATKEILLRAELVSPFVEVKICDRGPGVPVGCEEKVFDQFFRAHDSLGSGVQGSGLGLTLARQIARAHGGDVTYAKRDGGGSCFTLKIPRAT